MGNAKSAENNIETFLGAALLIGAGAMALRFLLDRRGGHERGPRASREVAPPAAAAPSPSASSAASSSG